MPEGANRFEETSFIQNYRNQGGGNNNLDNRGPHNESNGNLSINNLQ